MSFLYSHPMWCLVAAIAASQLVVVGLLGMCAAGKRAEEVTVVFNPAPRRSRVSSDRHARHAANQ